MRRVGLAAAAGALTVGAALAVPAAATPSHPMTGRHPVTGRHAATSRSSTNGWTQLSSSAVESVDGLSLAKFGKQVQFVWSQNQANRLFTRTVGSSGQPDTPARSLLRWASINTYPSISGSGDKRFISFSGLSGQTGSEYDAGYQYLLASGDGGKSFSLATSVLSSIDNAYGSYGSDTVMAGSVPVQAYTAGSASDVSVHAGLTAYPPSNTPDPHGADTGPYAYNTGLGYDVRTRKVWAAWYSNDTKRSHLGVDVQPVYPSFGKALHAPDSYSSYGGSLGTTAIGISQRIGVAVRAAGGEFVGYSVGYPQGNRVALWRIGSNKPMLLAASGNADGHVDAVAGTAGRVWLVWHDDDQRVLRLARTGKNGRGLSLQCTVALPHRNGDVYDIAGTAIGNDILVAVNSSGSGSDQMWSRIVKPCRPKRRR